MVRTSLSREDVYMRRRKAEGERESPFGHLKDVLRVFSSSWLALGGGWTADADNSYVVDSCNSGWGMTSVVYVPASPLRCLFP